MVEGFIHLEDSVSPGNLHVLVSNQRDLHLSQSPLLPGGVDPGQVGEVRVGGAGQHLAADLSELLGALAERDDLRGAHEGEVERVEEEDNVLALVVGQ